MEVAEFIDRWKRSGGAELANSQSFLKELCDVLGVPQPEPTISDEEQNSYVFEKAVQFNNGDGTFSVGRIDLYRANCFVLESKQGVERKEAEAAEALATVTQQKRLRKGTAPRNSAEWDRAMKRAWGQAKRYAEALPDWPVFLIVVDVGHCIDFYADFTQSGKHYQPFPDPKSYRTSIDQLRDEKIRDRLKAIWTDPKSLDPSRRAAQVTREIADRLARLAKSLEGQYPPEVVAGFLMRCLFTMFAEDIGLIPLHSFHELLLSLRFDIQNFQHIVEELWNAMDKGKFSTVIRQKLRHFNGGFFEDHSALPLTRDQLELLIEAASADWTSVEPAIFGTLLERALDPVERHKLGAHFTPRAYVERLVLPTIIEPLREEWDSVYAAAIQVHAESVLLEEESKSPNDKKGKEARAKRTEAQQLIRNFHGHLCEVRVLDPACGSGNFLYVSLELMKRLEGEVLNALHEFGDYKLSGVGIDPHQFLGIEINTRAAGIAELVLWIGFLQWHYRTRDKIDPPEPILKAYHNIECRDAVLAWDSIEPVFDAAGKPVTRWDGRTTKTHSVTGEQVPDDTARVQELKYINPRIAEWPKADYIVGNPPFIGNKRMGQTLGSAYVIALRNAFNRVPESVDYVMYWWNQSVENIKNGLLRGSGLITTNSITQSFNRKLVSEKLASGVRFKFAIADHPWVDSANGAAVRVAITSVDANTSPGKIQSISSESPGADGTIEIQTVQSIGEINSDLSIGADTTKTFKLQSNSGVVFQGVIPIGEGFRLDASDLKRLNLDARSIFPIVRPYVIGMDIVREKKEKWIIDLHGHSEEEVSKKFPSIYQHIYDRVRPVRLQNRERSRRENWWLFARSNEDLRSAIKNINQYIGVPDTSKYKPFVFIPSETLPDAQVYCIAIDNAWALAILSSQVHRTWCDKVAPTLEDRPRWKPSVCFDSFPFPIANSTATKTIRDLGIRLDSHRKRQQALHPTLTMTGMYNVLEKLRSGEPLTAKEKLIHEQGLVSVLKQIHDDLDAAVF